MNEDTNYKPTLDKPVNQQSKGFEKNFNRTMNQTGIRLNEVDGLLTEKEQSLKKKIFSLPKMEALVFSDPKLSAVYEEMAENGEEKYGYHYNETIQNMIFNDYVLNSPKYLQKYKMAIPKEKKRRDKSGINQLKKAGEKTMAQSGLPKQTKTEIMEENEQQTKVMFLVNENDPENPDVFAYFPEIKHQGIYRTAYSHIGQHSAIHPDYANESRQATPEEYQELKTELEGIGYNLEIINKDSISETSSTGSVGGSGMGSGGYVTPSAWGSGDLMKTKGKSKIMRKPIWNGGTIIQESNYLTDPMGFEKYVNELNEQNDVDFIQKNSEAYGSLDNMNPENLNIIKTDIQKGNLDEPNLNVAEEAKSKAQQRLFGMAHAAQKGEIPMSKLGGAAKKIAKTVSTDDVEDFASTKHEDLPEKVDEDMNEFNNKIKIFIDNYPWFLEKIDSTHFYMSNTENMRGMTHHVDQHRGETYYNDIRSWLKGGENPNGKEYAGSIQETDQPMIDTNPQSMANKPQPVGDLGGNVPMGTQQTGGMNNESHEIKNNNDMALLEELNKELEAFSIHHQKLVKMNEDRKISAEVDRQRVIDQNPTNFKRDLQHSGTKEIINVEKELQWKDQQTDVKDPQKLTQDIEKQEIKSTDADGDEHLKNVGDSANANGDEIPKRNRTKEEQDEVNLYTKGLHSTKFDTEPSKQFEDRMKADMGDEIYSQRQKQLKVGEKEPLYNKESVPTYKGEEMNQFNKYRDVNESMITGRYADALGKRRLIDFMISEVKLNENVENLFELDFTGLGNSYNSKTVNKKVVVNESVVQLMDAHKFYTDGKNIFAIKKPAEKINESTDKKLLVVNEQFDKMKHLLGYKPQNFVDTKNVKKNRGF